MAISPTEQSRIPSTSYVDEETGGHVLAINGGIALWYGRAVTNMRYGKYRLLAEVEMLGRNLYNGDA